VKFSSDPEEKLYGMGQYQQERMNLKGCGWVCAFTGKEYGGGGEIVADAPLERLPVFYRTDCDEKFEF